MLFTSKPMENQTLKTQKEAPKHTLLLWLKNGLFRELFSRPQNSTNSKSWVKTKPAVMSTVYPTNPPKDFNEWQRHLQTERNNIFYPSRVDE